jgi:hypothetical protein
MWRVGEERGLPSAAYPLHSPGPAHTEITNLMLLSLLLV